MLFKKILSFLLIFTMLIPFTACDNSDNQALTSEYKVFEKKEFNNICIDSSIDDFNAKGFKYGDSVDINFSNGLELKDIPYYDGYYSRQKDTIVCAYPGYEQVVIKYNWDKSKLTDKDTATITLKERGKYKEIQDSLSLKYTNEREDYKSDEVFANFRNISCGNLKANMLYRSASPCDNQYNRAGYVDKLIKEHKVAYILDLADDEKKVQSYFQDEGFNSQYYKSLYKAGKVNPVGLGADFTDPEYSLKVAGALKRMIKNDGPYLIHCTEGKDRTGYVCALLECLAGATYDEIANDYMTTYSNYYGVTKESNEKRYETILNLKFTEIMENITNVQDEKSLKSVNYEDCAKKYLEKAGMSSEEVKILQEKICK